MIGTDACIESTLLLTSGLIVRSRINLICYSKTTDWQEETLFSSCSVREKKTKASVEGTIFFNELYKKKKERNQLK